MHDTLTRRLGFFSVLLGLASLRFEAKLPNDRLALAKRVCPAGWGSGRAVFALRVAGQSNVVAMQIGFTGWSQAAAWKPTQSG